MNKSIRNKHRSGKLLEAIGYTPLRMFGLNGVFDLVGLAASDLVLVKVITDAEPTAATIEAIRKIPAPANCRKLVHVWLPGRRHPQVTEVTHTQP